MVSVKLDICLARLCFFARNKMFILWRLNYIVLHQLWQFETQDENVQNFCAFLMYFIVEIKYSQFSGLCGFKD